MYEEILKSLETKFIGVQKSIIERIAKKLATTTKTADEVQTAVDGVSFQQVLESYGDSRATDATKTAVLNYEKKHNLKDGKPVDATDTDAPDTTNNNEDEPAYVKALMKSVETLTQKVAEMQGAELTKSRKQRLDEIIAPLSELHRKGYERISLKDLKDDEFDSLLTEIQDEVGEMMRTQSVKGAVFGKPTNRHGGNMHAGGSSGVTEATDTEATEVVDKLNIV